MDQNTKRNELMRLADEYAEIARTSPLSMAALNARRDLRAAVDAALAATDKDSLSVPS